MSKKKIYIAGKVTGLSRVEASFKFGQYEKQLLEQGHEPVVPLNIVPKEASWEEAMKLCLIALLQCDEVHFLPCWTDSPGARIERNIALNLRMMIVDYEPSIKQSKQ